MQYQYWFIDGEWVVTRAGGFDYDLHLPTMRRVKETFDGVVYCLEHKRWTNDFLIQELKQIVNGRNDGEELKDAA